MDLGLTQRTLAERLGCCYPTVAAWENGTSQPLAARWPAIESLLGPGLVPSRDGLPGRVRTARLRLGLTQEQLAVRAGVHPRTVRNTELGTYGPSAATLGRLRGVLNLAE
jgi:transcriptional regulator with XRE-family HTH domain